MSANVPEVPKLTSPNKPRHQITRSITELSSPIKLHRHHPHHSHHSQHSQQHQHPSRKDRQHQDDRVPQSANPILEGTNIDLTKSEGVTPNRTPNQSHRASLFVPPTENQPTLRSQSGKKTDMEDVLRQEKDKAVSRAA
jgi:hypothetical protein